MKKFRQMFDQLVSANPEAQFSVTLKDKTAIVGTLDPSDLNLPEGWQINTFSQKTYIQNFSTDEANKTENRVFFEYCTGNNVKFNKLALWLANLTW